MKSYRAVIGGLALGFAFGLGGCGTEPCEEAREEAREEGNCTGFDVVSCAAIDFSTDQSDLCEEAFDTYIERCVAVGDDSDCVQCESAQAAALTVCGL